MPPQASPLAAVLFSSARLLLRLHRLEPLIVLSLATLFCAEAHNSVRSPTDPDIRTLAMRVDTVIRSITQGSMRGLRAKKDFVKYMDALRKTCTTSHASENTGWVFPLAGLNARTIGGNGKGYVGASAYDFFAGNAHKGHPALDLFIYDRNNDGLDDRIRAAVTVVTVSDGIVVSVTRAWSVDSTDTRGRPLRGGICAWIYDPSRNALLYYAHLARCVIAPGDSISSGTSIGTVGRTGKNAATARSTTHLHFMMLSLDASYPSPVNPVELLRSARIISQPGN